MSITALPTPPSRQDPVNFAVRGDAFMAALPVFATEANALAVEMEAAAATAASDAVAAAIAATSGSFVNTYSAQSVNGVKRFSAMIASAKGGIEGGEIVLEKPASGTTLTSDVTIDSYGDKLRIFATTPSGAKVVSLDLSGLPNGESSISGIYAGAVSYFATASAPAGWLKANGASLSTTTYAALFAAIGYTFGGSGASFNLPDLRGEFIRSLDDSRGVDAGRSLGTFQGDQNKSHNHGGYSGTQSADHTHTGTTGNQSADHTHGYSQASSNAWVTDVGTGRFTFDQNGAANTSGASTDHSHGFTTGGVSVNHSHAISSDGGTEVRVRNVAMLAAIKY